MNAPCRYGEFGVAASSPFAARAASCSYVRVREFPVFPALDRAQLVLERALGGGLHVEVERRVDLQALLVESRAELLVELLAYPFDEVRRDLA